jgi:hypothetical protein
MSDDPIARHRTGSSQSAYEMLGSAADAEDAAKESER